MKSIKDWMNEPVFFEEKRTSSNILIAKNGKKSNLNQIQYELVRTVAFKEWFGDWENDQAVSSKVVDENGEPLVVYHGTFNEFNVFDRNKIRNKGGGFYFSDNIKNAQSYYLRDQYNLYLFGKSISVDKKATAYFRNIFNPYIVKSYFLKLINPKIVDVQGRFWHSVEIGKDVEYKNTNQVTLDAYSLGIYDGVIYKNIIDTADEKLINMPTNTFVAYYSNQIKLADGTNTTFDENNLDIRYYSGGYLK